MFFAKEMFKRANNYYSVNEEEIMEKLSKKIEESADEGNYHVSITYDELNVPFNYFQANIVPKLRLLGYEFLYDSALVVTLYWGNLI